MDGAGVQRLELVQQVKYLDIRSVVDEGDWIYMRCFGIVGQFPFCDLHPVAS